MVARRPSAQHVRDQPDGHALMKLLLSRLRMARTTAREQGRVEERTRERERIARELHDTLLQSVQALVLKFGSVSRTLELPEAERQALDQAVEAAQEAIVESRDHIQGLRSRVDRDADLAGSLAAVGREAADGAAVGFSVVTQGAVRPLRPDALEVCYRVAREAIVNAFRHAAAASIEVQVIYGAADLRIRVRDDGVGLPAPAALGGRSRHWGLTGMTERVEAIGGRLGVWSRANAGTEIELVLGAQRAYADQRQPARWRQLVQRFVSGGLSPRGEGER
jgi:signal transduction histidine kinase